MVHLITRYHFSLATITILANLSLVAMEKSQLSEHTLGFKSVVKHLARLYRQPMFLRDYPSIVNNEPTKLISLPLVERLFYDYVLSRRTTTSCDSVPRLQLKTPDILLLEQHIARHLLDSDPALIYWLAREQLVFRPETDSSFSPSTTLQLPPTLSDTLSASTINNQGTRVVRMGNFQAYVWNALTGEYLFPLAGHTDQLISVAFNKEGTHVITASLDNTARIYDINSGACIKILSPETPADIDDTLPRICTNAFFHPSISTICLTLHDEGTYLWYIDENTKTRISPYKAYNACFSEDYIITAEEDGKVYIYDIDNPLLSHYELPANAPQQKYLVTINKKGTWAAAGHKNGMITLWDLKQPEQPYSFSAHTNKITSLCFSKKANILLTASKDATVKLWDITSRNCIRTITITLDESKHESELKPEPVYNAYFNKYETVIIAVSPKKIYLWNAYNGSPILAIRSSLEKCSNSSFFFAADCTSAVSNNHNTVLNSINRLTKHYTQENCSLEQLLLLSYAYYCRCAQEPLDLVKYDKLLTWFSRLPATAQELLTKSMKVIKEDPEKKSKKRKNEALAGSE